MLPMQNCTKLSRQILGIQTFWTSLRGWRYTVVGPMKRCETLTPHSRLGTLNPYAFNTKGMILFLTGDYSRAELAIRKGIAIGSTFWGNHLMLATSPPPSVAV